MAEAGGYIVEAAEGGKKYFLCPGPDLFWCDVTIERAWVHPMSSIAEIAKEFASHRQALQPQNVYEAFRDGGKTKLFSEIAMPFSVALENATTSVG